MDYVIHVVPEDGYDHGREAAGIADVWADAREWSAAGLLLLGCDVAADLDDLAAMRAAVLADSDRLLTGMIKLWPASTGRDAWIWSHRGGSVGHPAATQDEGTPVTYVSLGFLWVPARLLQLAMPFMAAWRWGQADVALSELALNHGVAAAAVPACRPKHLHFQGEHDGAAIRARNNRY